MAINKVKLSDNNVEYTKVINQNFSELEANKVSVEAGKGLSTNDFTTAEKTKLAEIAAKAQVNVIESVKVNGTAQEITNKAVDITVPTKTSDITNDSDFATNSSVDTKVGAVDSRLKTAEEKLAKVEAEADVNIIETVKVNGTALTVTDKAVDVKVPTKVSELTNDSSFATTGAVNTAITTALEDYDTSSEVDTKLAGYVTTETHTTDLAKKVDKVDGKGLSTNDYTTAEKTKLNGIATGAQVNVIEGVQVNGADLTITDKKVNVVIPEAAEYSVIEATADEGYAKAYSLTKDGTAVGAKINIPKDLVVSGGSVKEVVTAGQPYAGAVVGDKYIDLTLNDSAEDHIYIAVKDLVDVYTAGNGVNVSTDNKISVVVNSASANGLSVTANGLQLATATTTTAGAMSAADKTKLEGVEAGAQVNKIEKVTWFSDETWITYDEDTKTVDISPAMEFVNAVTVNGDRISGDIELVPGNNITMSTDVDNGIITINGVVPEAGTLLQTAAFTSADAGWSAIDSDGFYTLTIANTGTPLTVKKLSSLGGYETCMANIRHDGTKFYITSDAKFDGQVIFF